MHLKELNWELVVNEFHLLGETLTWWLPVNVNEVSVGAGGWFFVISAYFLPFHLMSVLLTVTVNQCTSVSNPVFLFIHCCWTDYCCSLLDVYCMYCESWFAYFFLSAEDASPTFNIQPLICKLLLWLEYCSIEMPTAWQWSAIQTKRLYIEWSAKSCSSVWRLRPVFALCAAAMFRTNSHFLCQQQWVNAHG